MATKGHRWKFFRAGGVDQVALRDGKDVMHLPELDQKLWVALAMPKSGVEVDARTLDLLDEDKDGRVRSPEILSAVKFVTETLRNPDDLFKPSDRVALSALIDGPVLAGAKRILVNLGKSDATEITLADVADTAKIFAATRFNGDGIVPADSAADDATKQVIADILSTHGEVPDRSGKPGVNQEKVDAFFTEAQALVTWASLPSSDAQLSSADAAKAADAKRAVRGKVDDYFVRCRLAALDARAGAQLNGNEAEFAQLASQELSASSNLVATLPLAHVEPGRPLLLSNGINPAWSKPVAALAEAATPLWGANKTSLSESDWQGLQDKLAPFEAWAAQKPVTAVEKLGLDRLRAILATRAREEITSLIAQDAALAEENAQIGAVERIVCYQRDLLKVLNNFVNFSEFYARKTAIFQAGTLYLDGRSCNLCVPVADPAKHGLLAASAAAYLAYCDCTRVDGAKMTIAAAFTDGDSDHLTVGRNGVFYDRQGRDWDATITKIIANPISVRQAFWAPYKKLVRLIEDQIGKRAAAADADNQNKLGKTATATANIDKTKSPEESKIDVGTVAAIGVAIGGIGAMLTGILGAFFGLGAWMPIGIAVLLLMISGPSMLLAFLKLRQRNLGPILDANGWAINGRTRINVPFGAALTDMPVLPAGSERSLHDPYAEKRKPWRTWLFLIVVVAMGGAWYLGKLDKYLPAPARSTSVLGKNAPAARTDAEAAAPAAPDTKK